MEFKILRVGGRQDFLEEVWQRCLEENLLDRGYETVAAHSREEALEILRRTAFDVLVVDLEWLNVSGQELIRQAKAAAPMIKILAVNTFPLRYLVGHDMFLQKPVSWDDLSGAIGTLLAQKDIAEYEQASRNVPHWKRFWFPWAQASILLFEPDVQLARRIYRFLRDPRQVQGLYVVQRTASLEDMSDFLKIMRPNLVLADLSSLYEVDEESPASLMEQLRKLQTTPQQPKEYLFFTHHSMDRGREPLAFLSGKRWTANPWDRKGLKSLAGFVHETALEHHLARGDVVFFDRVAA